MKSGDISPFREDIQALRDYMGEGVKIKKTKKA